MKTYFYTFGNASGLTSGHNLWNMFGLDSAFLIDVTPNGKKFQKNGVEGCVYPV